ncbi:MAG: glycoside hydrolase family 31 protein [Chitinophagales bacterium]|nr:glycoside hydrolase family 31 protein [Chitinophagales bacterium]
MNINESSPGKVTGYEEIINGVLIKSANQVTIQISFLTMDIVRIRYCTGDRFDDHFSYAINKQFQSDEFMLIIIDNRDNLIVKSETVVVNIHKPDSKIIFTDTSGNIICRDEQGFHWEEHPVYGGDIVKMSKVIQEGEHFYAMGDKTMHLNLRGRRVTNWAMDTYGFRKEEDPIYKAIPFYTAIHNNRGYGIFFDNTFKSVFDFGSERSVVTSFWAEGGEMNYYFINGPQLIDVTRRYTMLTGTPEMPPLWALGYQQSKWSYYPESKVRDVATRMRKERIPCDAIYLDIDYMDAFKPFTWDYKKFPKPKEMIADLEKEGFKTIVIIDPGIKVDLAYDVFKEGLANNYFCRRADGPYMKGKVWPETCYFPDFTNPKVRKWWSGLFYELIYEMGVSGIWNDMNEPALFEIEGKTFPDDVRHDFDGHPCSHRKAHNVYGMLMAKATYKGVKKYRNGLRPFILTRSAYAGTQRYAATWTGDNIASWEHLWIATMQCQRMAITGYSFVGADIGGFIDHPSPELYTRWVQLGAFQPFFRTHSSGDHGDQEPWSFGKETLNIVRKFIELRYQLLPYIYTAFYQYVSEYTPMIRPISYYDQMDSDTLYRVDEFLLGDHMLVCPILEPNVESRFVYLPRGQWYDYWTDTLWEGGKEIKADAPMDRIPIFIRAGAIIPMQPSMLYVGAQTVETLTLHVYYGGEETLSYLYEDAGDGYEYSKGIYNRKEFKTRVTADSFRVSLKVSGHFEAAYKRYNVVIHGLPMELKSVFINEKKADRDVFKFENNNLIVEVERTKLLSIEVKK